MVVEPIQKNNIKIKLSNTESVGQNIFKYTSFDKVKETKSKSSTCNYFLTTNGKLAKEIMEILNDFLFQNRYHNIFLHSHHNLRLNVQIYMNNHFLLNVLNHKLLR